MGCTEDHKRMPTRSGLTESARWLLKHLYFTQNTGRMGQTWNPLFTIMCAMTATPKVAKWTEPPIMDAGAPTPSGLQTSQFRSANRLVIRFVAAKVKAATQRLRNRIRRMGASRIARNKMMPVVITIDAAYLYCSFRALLFGLLQDGDVGVGVFPEERKSLLQPAPSIMLAKLPFRYRSMMGCQPNLVGVVPFLPLLLSSAQHMRAPVVEETLRNSQAATGSSY